MATFLEIKQGILRKLAWKDDKVGPLPIPLTSTTTAADALSIRDTALARGSHSAGNYDGRHVEIVETVTGSPTLGSVAAVDDATFDLTDKITTSPAFDDEVQAGTNYLMYPQMLVPETVADAINNVLKKTDAHYLWAPSLVADSDMDADDATLWPAVGTPTTREFTTTAANVLLGQRALKVVTVAADTDGARTPTFNTHEGETLLVCLPVSITTGDMRVVLYDATAGAAIKTIDELNDDAWTQVRFTQAVSADCETAYIQFLADTTAVSTFYVSPHVIVQSDRRTTYDAPSWLVSESQFIEALYLPSGHSAEADDTEIALSSEMQAAVGLDFLRSDRDVTPMHVTFANGGSYPVYLRCKRPFAELTLLTDTTPCDEEFLVLKAAAQILKNRRDDDWWALDREAEKRAVKLGYGGRQLKGEAPTVLV